MLELLESKKEQLFSINQWILQSHRFRNLPTTLKAKSQSHYRDTRSGNTEQRHHTSTNTWVTHPRDLLHLIPPVHAVQRCTRLCPARTVLPWLQTTACASSSSTQRRFILADWSKFLPILKVSQQQWQAANTDDFSSKPRTSSPARNKRYRPCFEYPVTLSTKESAHSSRRIFLQSAAFHCKHQESLLQDFY